MPKSLKSLILITILSVVTSTLSTGQRTIPDEKLIDYSTEDNTLREVLFELSELANVTIAFEDQIIPCLLYTSPSPRD